MFGLSNGDTDQGYADIDFAFYTYPGTGQLLVYEKGTYRGQFGAYAAGDTLRVAVASGVVKYYRNGALLYTSLQAPVLPLRVDTSLYSTGVVVANAVLSGTLVDVSSLPSEAVTWVNVGRRLRLRDDPHQDRRRRVDQRRRRLQPRRQRRRLRRVHPAARAPATPCSA